MKCSAVLKSEVKEKWDALAVGFFEGEKESLSALGKLDRNLKELVEHVFQAKKFEGKDREMFFTYLPGLKSATAVYFAGLGKKENHNSEKLKSLVSRLLKHAEAQKFNTLALDLKSVAPGKVSSHDLGRAVEEARVLSSFRFDKYKSKPDKRKELHSMDLLCHDPLERKEVQSGIKFGRWVADAANIARTLASEPANQLTPKVLASRTEELAKEAGLKCEILNETEIKKLNMGGLLGVAQGSHEPPRFIVLETNVDNKSQKPVILVGKGITFDSGGISLKPANDMEKMKYDMSGAAAVIATLWLAAKLDLPFKVIGLAPTCENLPSERPQRPGDIVTISNGKTVEVINTDAEGRMILADALSYAVKLGPRYIIDLATLTGSCRATFGEYAIGMMGNNRGLVDSLKDAGEKSGERCWELPLWDEYRDHIKGEFADLKNVGKGTAGAITAGKFLEEFVDKQPWAHLDIASTGWFDENHAYISRGPSGAGVRILAQFLKDLI
ncbi:MAG: hypothetical protein A2036_03200 [Omnitrophica bacterium GWA2_50_21]|nr:MAG: hypothetical protein A2036_03200 [Omnitrophica bacterium GWA2_50_21]